MSTVKETKLANHGANIQKNADFLGAAISSFEGFCIFSVGYRMRRYFAQKEAVGLVHKLFEQKIYFHPIMTPEVDCVNSQRDKTCKS